MANDIKTVILNVPFEKEEYGSSITSSSFFEDEVSLFLEEVKKAKSILPPNGFLFIYGAPNVISYLTQEALEKNPEFVFRYWIVININKKDSNKSYLTNNHIACIMLTLKQATLFDIDTEACRVARFACPVCLKNSKDWGGKKHLVNKKGTAISDVWNDFISVDCTVEDSAIPGLMLNISNKNESILKPFSKKIPNQVLERLLKLTKAVDSYQLKDLTINIKHEEASLPEIVDSSFDRINRVECGDSIQILKEINKKHPNGVFDLVFADPPYNLNKGYKNYDDENSDAEYIAWCDEWIYECFKSLKPNGNLLVLNLPKWTLAHINHMLKKGAYVEECIVWDAMSTPMGKIMPAHYSLIVLRKTPIKYKLASNYKTYPSFNYCLRPACINKRNELNSVSFYLSDIWSDVHRIKHKKDRDDHPCQLPDKLMERIIRIFSKPGDLVFDPFCGAGTTAIAAKMNERNFFTSDISQEYVDIATRKLNDIDTLGFVLKPKEVKVKSKFTKKQIETYTEDLFRKLGKTLEEEEFANLLEGDKSVAFKASDIIEIYGSLKAMLKKCKFVLRK